MGMVMGVRRVIEEVEGWSASYGVEDTSGMSGLKKEAITQHSGT